MSQNKKESQMDAAEHGLGFDGLVGLFEQTQTAMQAQAAKSVDIALVVRNWLFGWYIVEFENGGAERAKLYGKKLIDTLSKRLSNSDIPGMSPTNLRKFREFYQGYLKIQQTLSVTSLNPSKKSQETASAEAQIKEFDTQKIMPMLSEYFNLSWSHYVVLLTIKSTDERRFYELEAIENAWGIRELKRQINSSLYERLALSRDKEKVKELAQKGQVVAQPSDVLKSPYVLEFLGLQESSNYSEHQLETANIYASEYQLYLPDKAALKRQLEEAQAEWEATVEVRQ